MEEEIAAKNHDEMMIDYEDIWDDDVVVDRSDASSSSSSGIASGCGEEEEKQMLMKKGLVKVEEESAEFKLVKKSFLKGMEYMEKLTDLMAVYKNDVSCNLGRQARSDSFRIISQAVASNCGGNANVRYAWYGASLDQLLEIVTSGFDISTAQQQPHAHDSHAFGLHLLPAKFALDAAMCTVGKEDGSRHMLLCRVTLGRVEAVAAASKQRQPSSEDFNSGVDDISAPTKYIIWTAFMNSHIHPDYILSFKFTPSNDCPLTHKPSYPLLLAKLSKHLEPSQMVSLVKGYRQCQEQKITTRQWLIKMRKIIGNNLLASIIKNEYALS